MLSATTPDDNEGGRRDVTGAPRWPLRTPPPTEPGGAAAIRLERLTKRYPARPLRGDELDLTIPRGELVALVGPSGCGKTTTLKMINRLVEPTGGTVWLEGTDIRTLPVHELRRGIGYVIQQAGLFPHRKVADNIATVPQLAGWPKDRVRARSPSWPSWWSSTPTCSTATRRRCRRPAAAGGRGPGRWRPTRPSC